MLIRSKIPFYKQVPLYALKIKKVIYKSLSPALTTKLLSSPRILTKFAPVSPMIRQNKSNLNSNSILNRLTINPSTFKEKKQEESKVKPPKGTLSRYIPWIDNSKAKDSPLPTDMNTEGTSTLSWKICAVGICLLIWKRAISIFLKHALASLSTP